MKTTHGTYRDKKMALLRRLAAEVGSPSLPDMHIGIKLTDKDGKILEDRYEQGHSWTRNAWTGFNCFMIDSGADAPLSLTGNTSFRAGHLAMRSTAGVISSSIDALPLDRPNSSVSYNGFCNPSLDSSYGIVVGTSDEPFHPEDYRLWGHISNGVGAGQLSYLGMVVPVTVYNSGDSTWTRTYTRVFNNNSSGAIIIKETGSIYSGSVTALLSRDVLSSPINVPVGGQLTISISFTTVSFAAFDASCGVEPAIGALGSGGVYLGYDPNWYNSTVPNAGHTKYGMIVSPVIGGENSAKQWRTTNTAFNYPYDFYYGPYGTTNMYTLGVDSPAAQFCATANTTVLGGYSDWYIPSFYELIRIYNQRALLTGAYALTNASYWTSSNASSGSTTANYVNPTTGANSNDSFTANKYVRLVRRCAYAAGWVPM